MCIKTHRLKLRISQLCLIPILKITSQTFREIFIIISHFLTLYIILSLYDGVMWYICRYECLIYELFSLELEIIDEPLTGMLSHVRNCRSLNDLKIWCYYLFLVNELHFGLWNWHLIVSFLMLIEPTKYIRNHDMANLELEMNTYLQWFSLCLLVNDVLFLKIFLFGWRSSANVTHCFIQINLLKFKLVQ
jgi:hypothetical protein